MADLESHNTEKPPSQEPEIDYSPKEHSLKELLLIGLIFLGAAAVFILPIMFYES
jgi:hypothetical protein